jgi:hypothetical protein
MHTAIAQGKLFLAATRVRRHVAINPIFVGSLPFFFLKSVGDVWFLTGVDRWVWEYQGFIY